MKFSKQDEENLQKVIKRINGKANHISITECKEFVQLATECVESVKHYIEFYESNPFKPEDPVIHKSKNYLVSQLYRFRDEDGNWQWTACDLINNKGEVLKEVNISEIQPYSVAAKVLFGKTK